MNLKRNRNSSFYNDFSKTIPSQTPQSPYWSRNFDNPELFGLGRNGSFNPAHAMPNSGTLVDQTLFNSMLNKPGSDISGLNFNTNGTFGAKDILADIALDTAADSVFDKAVANKGAGLKGVGSKIKGWWGTNVSPNFGYSLKDGAKVFGKNLGGWKGIGTIGVGALQGINALQNLGDLDTANESTEDLINEIITSAGSNPLVNSYLTADQRSLLRKAKAGDLDPDGFSLADIMPDSIGDLTGGLKGVLMGIPGGLPGMIVGGVGGLVNSGLEGTVGDAQRQNSELEALLAALEDAEMQYQSMKRPNFTGLGIQQRYQDMYR